MENLQNTEMENEVTTQDVESTQEEQKQGAQGFHGSLVLGGTIEMTCMALMGSGLILMAVEMVSSLEYFLTGRL